MRTPRRYVEDLAEEVLSDLAVPLHHQAANDQYHAEIKRLARNVGLNPDSPGFKASLLLACDLFDGLAQSLRETENEDREEGAFWIQQASARLRLLSIWGESCHKGTCLDLR